MNDDYMLKFAMELLDDIEANHGHLDHDGWLRDMATRSDAELRAWAAQWQRRQVKEVLGPIKGNA